MNVTAIANSVMAMRQEQLQQNISMTAMKQAANQMEQMADMLMQSAKEAQAITKNSGGGFSVYA
ncbi:MAG: putative motility protein [Syntrophobacterales bacterium]|jgi:proteasome assembly chaperone (PAC2) family protein|nr:putative motility protein [Syntrophobacterales bacterium]